jgi:hypothetical protein
MHVSSSSYGCMYPPPHPLSFLLVPLDSNLTFFLSGGGDLKQALNGGS